MNEKINISVTEEDSVNVTVHDNIVYLSKDASFYDIQFDTDTTDVWAIFSKFTGKIADVELTNIDSYKIDGVTVGLPFIVELDTTYLIEVVKTNPSLSASIKFEVSQTAFTENIDLPDFSKDTGDWDYLLGDNTDMATNRTLLKLDTDLLKPTNSLGGGLWSASPINTTLTLPLLPANGFWRFVMHLTHGKILVSGGNIGSKEKYFCLVDEDTDIITDLDGTVNTYSSFFTGSSNYLPRSQFYDYLHNLFYYIDNSYGNLNVLNLKDNTISEKLLSSALTYYLGSLPVKGQFNPYRRIFIKLGGSVDFEADNTSLSYHVYRSQYAFFNHIYNEVYIEPNNNTQLFIKNDKNRIKMYLNTVGTSITGTFGRMTIDHNNRVVTLFGSGQFAIYRINDANQKRFYLADKIGSEYDYVFLKDNIHCLLTDDYSRIHLVDASDPNGTVKPDYNYYDLPVKCWSMASNRII